jgi:hypothetical protein
MKAQQQKTTSTQAQTFEYSRVLQFSTGEISYRRMAPDGYPLYIDPNNDPYSYLKRPNPPTPEAVARAQFVDKTYVWKEPGKETKPS